MMFDFSKMGDAMAGVGELGATLDGILAELKVANMLAAITAWQLSSQLHAMGATKPSTYELDQFLADVRKLAADDR